MLVHEGWYYDPEFTMRANIGDEIRKNVKLYAKWIDKVLGLTITADDNDISVRIMRVGNPENISLNYTINGEHWNAYTIGNSIELEAGQSIAFKGDNTSFSKSSNDYYQILVDGDSHLSGNIMYLVDSTGEKRTIDNDYQFAHLFDGLNGDYYGNSFITIAEGLLPATTLKPYCYSYMFANDAYVEDYDRVTIPNNLLPALDLSNCEFCYLGMFYKNNFIRHPGERFLPATTISKGCYAHMFDSSEIRVIPTDFMLAEVFEPNSCSYMFYNARALMRIKDNFCKPITIGDFAMEYMFCGSNVEDIGNGAFNNVEKVGRYAMQFMFNSCPGLVSVHPDYFKFKDKDALLYDGENAFLGIFQGSFNLSSAPVIYFNATTNTCSDMFEDTRINSVTIASNITTWGSNAYWLRSSIAEYGGNFYCPEYLVTSGQLPTDSYHGIPRLWTIHYI